MASIGATAVRLARAASRAYVSYTRHHRNRGNAVKKPVTASCKLSITEFTVYVIINKKQTCVSIQSWAMSIRIDDARVGNIRLQISESNRHLMKKIMATSRFKKTFKSVYRIRVEFIIMDAVR
jgi:hypothetical protein